MKIGTENILTSFDENSKYVYSKTENRIYRKIGGIQQEKKYGSYYVDKTPRITVDNGLNETVTLNPADLYELSVHDDFDFEQYAKNLK